MARSVRLCRFVGRSAVKTDRPTQQVEKSHFHAHFVAYFLPFDYDYDLGIFMGEGLINSPKVLGDNPRMCKS